MANCIICEQPIIQESDEHIIPYAIGGRITLRQVCGSCNSKLGDKVDCLLTDDPFIILLRNAFDFKTRDNKPVDIIKTFSFSNSDGNPTVIKRGSESNLPPLYDGTQKPEVKFTRLPDGKINMSYSGSDMLSIVKKAKREAKKLDIDISEEELKDIVSRGNLKVTTTRATADVTANWNNYIPCITKIAFEIGYMLFHEQFLQDKRGKELQRFLYNFIHDQYANDFHSHAKIEYDYFKLSKTHSITINLDKEIVYINIILFGGIQISMPLTYDPQNYNLENIINKNLIILLKHPPADPKK